MAKRQWWQKPTLRTDEEFAVDLMRQQFADTIKGKYHALDRLQAVITVSQKITVGKPLSGGCPVVNTAVQSTHTHPQLQAAARQTTLEWQDFIVRIIQRGIERQQLRADIDPAFLAILLISTLEGAIILTQIHQNEAYMNRTIQHLNHYLNTLSLPSWLFF